MSLEFAQLSLKYNCMLSIIKENIQTKLFFLQYQELVKNLPRDYMCCAPSLQSCLTLCNPMDSSPSGSPVHGILQARILEWVSISFFRGIFPTQRLKLCLLFVLYWQVGFFLFVLFFNHQSYLKVKERKLFSRVQLFATPQTIAYQAPLSMEFSREEYQSGLPFLSTGDLPNPGVKPRSPMLQADTLPSEPPGKPKFLLQHQELIPSSQRLYRFLNFVLYIRVLSKHISAIHQFIYSLTHLSKKDLLSC